MTIPNRRTDLETLADLNERPRPTVVAAPRRNHGVFPGWGVRF